MFPTSPCISTLKVLDAAYSSVPYQEDAPWFTCKGRLTETYLGSESFKNLQFGLVPKQAQGSLPAFKPLHLIKVSYKYFILIKRFTVDNTRAFESQDVTAFVRKSRKIICTSLSYLLTQLQVYQSQLLTKGYYAYELDQDTSNLLSSLVKEIETLLTTGGSISDINNIRRLRDFNEVSPSDAIYYHYVHACFDVWYNSIAILQIISNIPFGAAKHEVFSNDIELNPFMHIVTSFLKDFACLAINYYYSFRKSAPFPCGCFQELWIMLINILEKEPSGEEHSFWFVYNKVIQELLDPSSNSKPTNIFSFVVNKIENKDLTESCLWLTSYIANLYKYDMCGNYCESKTPKSGYGVLKHLLNKLLALYSDGRVENIRFSLFHTMQLISLWEPNCEVILPLTDYFIKKIGEMFGPSSAEIAGLSYMFKSSTLWFQYINKLSYPCTSLGKESSLDLFLHIMTKQLSKDSTHRSLWRLLKGRIYSKLTAKKMKELSEVGLQNSFSLLLAIAESGQMEVTDKICELAHVIESTLSPRKQMVSWKALFVLMHIHQKKAHKLNKIISEVTKLFNETCSAFSTITRDSMHKSNVMNLLLVYIDCMGEVFEQCHNLSLSEYQLIGSGFSTLLPSCGITELNYVLNVFLNILNKVKNTIGDNSASDNYAVEMQYTTFMEFIFNHIYPFIESISTTNTPPDLVSDIAVLLMSLSYKCTTLLTERTSGNYCEIFVHFTTKEVVNIPLVCRFLCLLLDDMFLVSGLKSKMSVCQIIFQLWLKCIVNLPPSCHELEELTPKVILQKEFVEMFPKVLDLNLRSHDYVFTSIALFRVMGETYDSNTDPLYRKQLRETMLCYFKTYVPCVLKRITTQRDGLTLNYVYKHISHLFEHCSLLLHIRGNPESIVPKIIDKTVIPHLVFPKDKPSQTILFCAIKEYLPNFIRGLFKLDYKNDMCIQREIKDIMINYACNYPPHSNPITRLIIDTVNGRPEGLKPETFDFLLEVIRANVLLNPSITSTNGFTMLHDILRFTPSVKKNSIITVLLKSSLEVYMRQGSNFFRDLIKKIVERFQEKELNNSKTVLVPILQWFIKEKLQWATVKAFNILDIFAENLPQMFQLIVSYLLETVKTLEINRGSGPDDVIREYLKRTLSKLPKSNNFDKMV
ncbi:hypothetical protein JTE90_013093 [Oedothorax gibbosus]|uniref:Protein MMS22-like n=1 Tax=Oedothorax gibbosus TaxID=931172 RepID=A0AAV6ULW7_9ARAC|nr:hypothetical protein JTE90_013093 [Oedothorax gibbosus]